MIFLILLLVFYGSNCLYYDSYNSTEISVEDFQKRVAAGLTTFCTNEAEPCNETEGRRIDGTCNNLQYPVWGGNHTPYLKALPSVYDDNFEPRKSVSGSVLPLPRVCHMELLATGTVAGVNITQLATNYFGFMASDITSSHDTTNYVSKKPYCCLAQGKTDPECVPNEIPEDDPVHRWSGIRCQNMTRPKSFQSVGCVRNDTAPDRVTLTTPLFDFALIYGTEKTAILRARQMEGGLLKTEVSNGIVWPPSQKNPPFGCTQNEADETRCHDTPNSAVNGLGGANMFSIWFWRNHNKIAKSLAILNPCWNDEKLFTVARDINTAMGQHMFYYELMPVFFGYKNLVKKGVILSKPGLRDIYNSTLPPQLYIELPYVLRFIHTMQSGDHHMYDANGTFIGKIPVNSLMLRTGYLEKGNNLAALTQGTFRQPSGGIDYIADPMWERGMGKLQKMLDIFTNDLAKGRYFGLQPYIKYREMCFGDKITSFDDLKGIVEPAYIRILQKLYARVEDMDLMAVLWVEKLMPGAITPPTFFCLVTKQLIRNVASDRHWYERPNRPNAFTEEQLGQIRRMTVAKLLCDNADGVDQIQPKPFLILGEGNEITSCAVEDEIFFRPWQDTSCNSN